MTGIRYNSLAFIETYPLFGYHDVDATKAPFNFLRYHVSIVREFEIQIYGVLPYIFSKIALRFMVPREGQVFGVARVIQIELSVGSLTFEVIIIQLEFCLSFV